MALSIGGAYKKTGNGSTWPRFYVPNSMLDGDTMVAFIAMDGTTLSSPPAGFTQIVSQGVTTQDTSNIFACLRYYETAPAAGGFWDLEYNLNEFISYSFWIRGAAAGVEIKGAAGTITETLNTNSPVCTAPSAGGTSGDITFAFAGTKHSATPEGATVPTGMTTLVQDYMGTGSGDPQMLIAYESWVDNEAHTWADCANSRDWGGISFVLGEPSTGPAIPVPMHHRQQQGES